MVYEVYFKCITRRTASDKMLRDKAFNIAKNWKYDGYQKVPVSVVYRVFWKKRVLLLKMKSCKIIN